MAFRQLFRPLSRLSVRVQSSKSVGFQSVRNESGGSARRAADNSPLFVSGERLNNTVNVVIPDLDVGERFSSEDLSANLEARGLGERFDLDAIRKGGEMLEGIDRQRYEIEKEVTQTQVSVQALKDKGELSEQDQQEIEELVKRVKECRQSLKKLNEDRAMLESSTILPFLDLPNVLDKSCPIQEDEVLHTELDLLSFDFETKTHMELCPEEIQTNGPAVYLKGRLAKLELLLPNLLRTFLLEKGYNIMASPDLAKSVVLEGCGVDFEDERMAFSLVERPKEFDDRSSGQGMHLVGGASIYPFVSYFSKNIVVNPSNLPQSFFCVGRRYRPSDSERVSLFNSRQSTAVQVFNVSVGDECEEALFDAMVEDLRAFYSSFGKHFKIQAERASALDKSESYKVGVYMHSSGENDYVEVGSLSRHGDYFSKRMMLKATEKDNDVNASLVNLRVIGGTFMNVSKVIGCLVENSQKEDGSFVL